MNKNNIQSNSFVQLLHLFNISKEGIDLFLEIERLGTPTSQYSVGRFELVKTLSWTKAKVEKYIKELHIAGFITPHQVFKAGGTIVSIQSMDKIVQIVEEKITKLESIKSLLTK
jgi:predicted transcriptional regulator